MRRKRNERNIAEKISWAYVFLVVVCFCGAMLAFVCLGGCATTKSHSGGIRESDSYFVGKLETSIENFDRGIGEAVERSRRIEDELERVDYLFGQYEQAVGRLRDEVNSLRDEIERLEKVRDGSGDASPSVYSDKNHNISLAR